MRVTLPCPCSVLSRAQSSLQRCAGLAETGKDPLTKGSLLLFVGTQVNEDALAWACPSQRPLA